MAEALTETLRAAEGPDAEFLRSLPLGRGTVFRVELVKSGWGDLEWGVTVSSAAAGDWDWNMQGVADALRTVVADVAARAAPSAGPR